MYIEIKVKGNDVPEQEFTPIHFPIDLKDLETTVEECYVNLGTQYQPIRIDNFVTLGEHKFPTISPNTELWVKLVTERGEEDDTFSTAKLVCCKVKNVGKVFNNGYIEILENQWNQIFDLDSKRLITTPDGFLYVIPDEEGSCTISTLEKPGDAFIAYSILFSFSLKKRTYYFVLDPVVRVSSGHNVPL